MRTPDFRQLADLQDFLLYSLQHDASLLAQCGTTGEIICRSVVGFQALEVKEKGVEVYATEIPCLAVWPKHWAQECIGGITGWRCDLGVQYLFRSPVGETGHPMLERATHWLNAIAWKLLTFSLSPLLLAARATPTVVSGSIYRVHFDAFDPIPMLENNLCGLDGVGVLETKHAPWAPSATQPLYDLLGEFTVDDVTPDPYLKSKTTVGTRP